MSEDDHQRGNSSDEVMDTTEPIDFSDGDPATREEVDVDDEGLFGSGSDEGDEPTKKRKLDDEDLDSGDDEGRHDRMDEDMDGYGAEEIETQHSVSMADIEIGRHPIPHDADGEVWTRTSHSYFDLTSCRRICSSSRTSLGSTIRGSH